MNGPQPEGHVASCIQRRKFLATLGGAAAWPLAARAQQTEHTRRIGVLMNTGADDPQSPLRLAAFLQGLSELGWIDGRNVRIEYRWGAGDPERYRRYAAELVALAPDVILTPLRSWGYYNKQRAPCQSYSPGSSTQSVPVWSRAWRGR